MKKLIAMLLALSMVLAFAGCGQGETEETTEATQPTETTQETEAIRETTADGTLIMNFAEYVEADSGTQVCVETYVQAKHTWASDKVTIYAQDQEGAYYINDLTCSKEDEDELVPGTKIRVTGFKITWEGGHQIVAGTYEILEGEPYIVEPMDMTEAYASRPIKDNQNRFATIKGMTIEPSVDADGNEVPFVYGDNAAGESYNDDLFFNASLNGTVYSFTVESHMADCDAYETVQTLEIGQTVDLEGFLMYPGVSPHITSVTVVE